VTGQQFKLPMLLNPLQQDLVCIVCTRSQIRQASL
jgi:hypothetical protein